MSDLGQPGARPDERQGAARILQEVRRSTVVDGALREMLRQITAGYWKPGERIATEEWLAGELAVGRSTIREAKGILIAIGVLESRGTKGTFVAEQSADLISSSEFLRVLSSAKEFELYEARALLETEAIRLATERATEAELQQLADLLDQMRDSLDSAETFWPLAVRFHFDLAKASHNAVLVELVQVIASHLEKIQMPLYRARSSPPEALALHEELLNAVASRDTEVALAEMRRHLNDSLDGNGDHAHSRGPEGGVQFFENRA
jgi:GntR family transcriptional repressor for pyruvate dehydrogenase complex